jgi:hypothetical protein
VDYAERLRSLSRPDLEQLLANRPETSALSGRRTAGYSDLAGLLALPLGTARAIASLDRFHHQVLELACLAGGRLAGDFAASQGLEPEWLAAAAAELARWGLGFPDAGGLSLPAHVVAAVDEPGRLGPPAASGLALLTPNALATIALTLGAARIAASKSDMIDLIAARLRDADAVRQLVDEAPPRAARVLEALRALGGTSHWTLLAQEVPFIHTERALGTTVLRPAEDGLGWLRCRALVLWLELERRLTIPAEVELALRGRLFPTWQPEPPALDLAPPAFDRHPAELVIEVTGMLEHWREPVALIQSGDLGARERHRVAAATGVPEGAVGFLANLAIMAGLLAVEEPPARARARGRSRRPASPAPARLAMAADAVATWRRGGVAERWLALVGGWRQMVVRSEPAMNLALEELLALPDGTGAGTAGLARRLAWLHPGAFPDAEAAAEVVDSTAATLHRLGIGGSVAGAGWTAGVSELGRMMLGGRPLAELAPLFPPTEGECTVTADLRVIVAGPPEPELANALARLADLEAAAPARIYRLSEASLRRALDGGMSAAGIADLLRSRCPSGVPQNVTALIEDVGRRHGRLRVGRATLYVQADDPVLIAQVAADRRLRGLGVRVLAPTLAVVEGTEERHLLEALRKAGYMPAVESAASSPPNAGARRRPAPAVAAANGGRPAPADPRALAERLLAGAG